MSRLARALVAGAALWGAAACGSPRQVAPPGLVGVWHAVAAGDTAGTVAAKYGADPAIVVELNDLPPGGALDGRSEIFVPTADGAAPGTGEKPRPLPGTAATASDGAPPAPPPPCGEGGRPCLAWPAGGRIAARFAAGAAVHDGIDIAAVKGAPITAAEAGRVIYSGDGIQGYGNLILIRHEGGLITVYAHNDKNEVGEGDSVERGQRIASVGQSGSATAPHLHFEVREGERPRDPLAYLPEEEGR